MNANALPERRLYTLDEVVVAVGLPRKRVTRMALRGELPRVVLDTGCHRYDIDDVLLALKQRYGEGDLYESTETLDVTPSERA